MQNTSLTEHVVNNARTLAQTDVNQTIDLNPVTLHIVEVAILIALRSDEDEIKTVIRRALNAGVSLGALSDTVLQLSAYLGFSRVSDAAKHLDEVAKEQGSILDKAASSTRHDRRYESGIAAYSQLNPHALTTIREAFDEIAGRLIDSTFRSFSDTFAQSQLDVKSKQMVTVGALAAVGNASPQLQFHVGSAQRVGVTQAQIIDIIMLVQLHAGMPAAYNALVAVKAAFNAGTGATPGYR